jgi:hypothetical protein
MAFRQPVRMANIARERGKPQSWRSWEGLRHEL